MKRIVYLTFYFKPDLCAGSFRNSPLAIELARQAKLKKAVIDLYTTFPNRYNTFKTKAPKYEYLQDQWHSDLEDLTEDDLAFGRKHLEKYYSDWYKCFGSMPWM